VESPLGALPEQLLLTIGGWLGARDLLHLQAAARPAFGRGLACYGGRSVAEEAARLQCHPAVFSAESLVVATEVVLPACHW
jgi:hypothetical protein